MAINRGYYMVTTDSGNNEDYNINYCPIYKVEGPGDHSEPIFLKTTDSGTWVADVEALGYEVEKVDLNFVIEDEFDDEEEEE